VEDFKNIYKLLKKIDPDFAEINIFNILPKTDYYNEYGKKIDWGMHSQENLNNYLFSKISKTDYIDNVLKYARLFDEHNESKIDHNVEKSYNFSLSNDFSLDNITLYNYASLLKRKKIYLNSINLFKSLIKSGFNLAGIYYHLGDLYQQISDLENSKKYLYKSLKVNSEHKKTKMLLEKLKNV
jgi:tetratricopeptide (TPR) repeat protein